MRRRRNDREGANECIGVSCGLEGVYGNKVDSEDVAGR